MRESIGNSFIFTLVLIFVGIIIAFLIGSLSYSKAFKVKNRIINIIQKYPEGYQGDSLPKIDADLDVELKAIGYKINRNYYTNCPTRNGAVAKNRTSNYEYCIYEYESDRGNYYGVLVYMYFDIPFIGDRIKIPIYGETKIMYDLPVE